MATIKLFEFEPTRSLKCRWILAEAGLGYESVGNKPDIIGTDELREIHPLGKLPAAVIDGKPLFESSAIVTAIADLVPEQSLVARPGTWERALHDQWTCFATSELEMWAWSTMLNTWDIFMPEDRRVPAIVEQNKGLFRRGASALERVLAETDYIMGGRFSATDIIVSYPLSLGRGVKFLDDLPKINAYLDRLYERDHCTLPRPE